MAMFVGLPVGVNGLFDDGGPEGDDGIAAWGTSIIILFIDVMSGIYIIPHGGWVAYIWLGFNALAVSVVGGLVIAKRIVDRSGARKHNDAYVDKVRSLACISSFVVAALLTLGIGKLVIPPEKTIRRDNNNERAVTRQQTELMRTSDTIRVVDAMRRKDGNYVVTYQDNKGVNHTIIQNRGPKPKKDDIAVVRGGKCERILFRDMRQQQR